MSEVESRIIGLTCVVRAAQEYDGEWLVLGTDSSIVTSGEYEIGE